MPRTKIVMATMYLDPGTETQARRDSKKARNAVIRKGGQDDGIPVADLENNVRINQYNYTSYFVDTIHPNEVGSERIAEVFLAII